MSSGYYENCLWLSVITFLFVSLEMCDFFCMFVHTVYVFLVKKNICHQQLSVISSKETTQLSPTGKHSQCLGSIFENNGGELGLSMTEKYERTKIFFFHFVLQ